MSFLLWEKYPGTAPTMKLLFRCYHLLLKLIVLLVRIPDPRLFEGDNAVEVWLAELRRQGLERVLLVTDPTMARLGIAEQIASRLKEAGIAVSIFDGVQPNPTVENVERALALYQESGAEGLVAIGGGSVIDCAKLVGGRAVRPNKTVADLKGLFKVLRRLPSLSAIPTTAGTGSETTVAAVITDDKTHVKYAVTDLCLVPKYAVLMPELTRSLPPFFTATTGIDALTHAIEAYIGINGLPFSDGRALAAIDAIFTYLPRACRDGDDMEARAAMLKASFQAGQAFTRTSVGYVHAIAHQFGARYGTPHGLANAVMLMPVLNWYGWQIDKKLAQICDYCRLARVSDSDADKARTVRERVNALLSETGVPGVLADLKAEDIPALARAALAEAHPDYPVPRFINQAECEALIRSVCPAQGDPE